ncbi:sugar phosphate isomerase/epimerase family protein [Streptomyces flaveolus]|uniref:sugar phosphate isomerase/epimerase family protein n=1 Tax=Streptomyces flaveolus TaxID=67297 RepID=UPI0033F4526C
MSASLSEAFAPCLNPATLSGLPLREFLAVAAGAGFPTVEVSIQQAQAHGTGPLRDLLHELGLTVAAASGILPAGPVLPAPLLVDPDTYRACLNGLDGRLEAMAALGCTVATTVLNPRSPLDTIQARAVARERIAELADAAAGHGIRLAVEAVSVQADLPADLDGPHPVAGTLPQVSSPPLSCPVSCAARHQADCLGQQCPDDAGGPSRGGGRGRRSRGADGTRARTSGGAARKSPGLCADRHATWAVSVRVRGG